MWVRQSELSRPRSQRPEARGGITESLDLNPVRAALHAAALLLGRRGCHAWATAQPHMRTPRRCIVRQGARELEPGRRELGPGGGAAEVSREAEDEDKGTAARCCVRGDAASRTS
jgi:hypothetical protein